MLMVGAGWHARPDVLVACATGKTPAAPYRDSWSRLEDDDRRLPT